MGVTREEWGNLKESEKYGMYLKLNERLNKLEESNMDIALTVTNILAVMDTLLEKIKENDRIQ